MSSATTAEAPNFVHLKKWVHPECYLGETYYDYYVFLGRHRDSDLLTNSNFEVGLKQLQAVQSPNGDPEGNDTVYVARASHDLVGWVEIILVHESDTAALKRAEELLGDLDGYPVLDEDAWSQREDEYVQEYWDGLPVRCRDDYVRWAELSIFAARHKWDKISELYPDERDSIRDRLLA